MTVGPYATSGVHAQHLSDNDEQQDRYSKHQSSHLTMNSSQFTCEMYALYECHPMSTREMLFISISIQSIHQL